MVADATEPRGRRGGAADGKRRRRGVLTAVAGLAVLAVGLPVARTTLVPWAYPLPGQPRLTGYWQGRVAYTDTDSRQVLLQIRHDENCSMACDVTGRIKVCGSGANARGDLAGDVHDWRGSRFTLDPYLPRAEGEVNIDELHGEWHGDVIRMRAEVAKLDATGAWNSSRQPPPPPAFEMRHIDEADFESGCAAH